VWFVLKIYFTFEKSHHTSKPNTIEWVSSGVLICDGQDIIVLFGL
jgi:hypothetical protein